MKIINKLLCFKIIFIRNCQMKICEFFFLNHKNPFKNKIGFINYTIIFVTSIHFVYYVVVTCFYMENLDLP